ncbi:MAG: hypothetical protein V3U27_19655, partial [Candidatus Tectomicrobia bacterium]
VPDPFQPDQPDKPNQPHQPRYDALVLAVPHKTFRERGPEEYLALLRNDGRPGVLVDLKGVLRLAGMKNKENPGFLYWSL